MKRYYATKDELNADAKADNMKVVVGKPALEYPETDPPTAYYYEDDDGNIYRQFDVVDNQHLMMDGMFVHVDDVLAMGTAGTIKMPLTGTILSQPRPDAGESLAGYFLRTSKQSGGTPSQVGKFLATVAADPTKADPRVVSGQGALPATGQLPLAAQPGAGQLGAAGQSGATAKGAGPIPGTSPAPGTSIKGATRTNPLTKGVETFDGTVWRDGLGKEVGPVPGTTTAPGAGVKGSGQPGGFIPGTTQPVGGVGAVQADARAAATLQPDPRPDPTGALANARAAATMVPTQRPERTTVLVGAPFVPNRTGTPLIDWPLFVDVFTHLTAYTSAAIPSGAGELTPNPVGHRTLPGAGTSVPGSPSPAAVAPAEGVAARRAAAAATAAQAK